MKPLDTSIDLDSVLLHITPEEAEAPTQVIQDYCDEHTLSESRAILKGLVKTALIYDERYNNIKERERLLLWQNDELRLTEGIYAQQQILQDQAEFTGVPANIY